MNVIDVATSMLLEHGEAMVLARAGEVTTIALTGKRIFMRADIMGVGGSAAQQEFRVKISTVEIAASAWTVKKPLRKDTITIDGRARTVLDARPLRDSGEVALYVLEVAG